MECLGPFDPALGLLGHFLDELGPKVAVLWVLPHSGNSRDIMQDLEKGWLVSRIQYVLRRRVHQ